mmetsp:Transcript_8594/g.18764  ORF Transcript_8594/g.18764 Transcript_8594/m.18764 type:complete len:1194 (+) Transcript_8594:146-3727(+)|eukprot:CAMPEP_0170568674 /NCGR_PEP_ID=MMETSP0224-20130122/87_1 /TAXON_ID=285029 /ORGANISM="Togula jolla, Strain CCCM 725" /LENGTH=1193 /DNA_ID=CAMNT_0010890669 /DNA_START=82 /DNA_END=3663 /DNA_ORIENTATION=+
MNDASSWDVVSPVKDDLTERKGEEPVLDAPMVSHNPEKSFFPWFLGCTDNPCGNGRLDCLAPATKMQSSAGPLTLVEAKADDDADSVVDEFPMATLMEEAMPVQDDRSVVVEPPSMGLQESEPEPMDLEPTKTLEPSGLSSKPFSEGTRSRYTTKETSKGPETDGTVSRPETWFPDDHSSHFVVGRFSTNDSDASKGTWQGETEDAYVHGRRWKSGHLNYRYDFKRMQQSVLEPVRLHEVEIHLSDHRLDSAPVHGYRALVTIMSLTPATCCRGPRTKVFCSCYTELRTHAHHLSLLGAIKAHVFVPRSERLKGNCHLRVTFFAEHHKWHIPFGRGKPRRLASLRALLPCGLQVPYTKLQLHPEGVSKVALDAWVSLDLSHGAQVVHARDCRPGVTWRGDEWMPSVYEWPRIWANHFDAGLFEDMSALTSFFKAELKKDAILMYQTLFSAGMKGTKLPLSQKELEEHDLRVLFLKRLIICLAVCRITFTTEENGTPTHPWPYPIASALCHGCRVIMRLDGVPWREMINFLLLGDPNGHNWDTKGVPSPVMSRWAASHAVGLDERSCRVFERKLSRRNAKENLKDGLSSHHLGLDLPVGGLGNPAPINAVGAEVIGPAGVPYGSHGGRKDQKTMKPVVGIQHGHLYFRWSDFGIASIPVLHHMGPPGEDSSAAATSVQPSQHSTMGKITSTDSLTIAATMSCGVFTAGTAEAQEASTQHSIGVRRELRKQKALELKRLSVSSIAKGEMSNSSASDSDEFLKTSGETLASPTGPSKQTLMSGFQSTVSATGWVQMAGCDNIHDLRHLLRQHHADHVADQPDEELIWLNRHLHKELFMRSNNVHGNLSCRALIIHIVFEAKSKGKKKVLVHKAAFTRDLAPKPPMVRVEDVRMPTTLRQRHEPWAAAVKRFCQDTLRLSAEAADTVVRGCRQQMDEMYIYKCEQPKTLCHYHRAVDEHIEVGYMAYRVKFQLPSKDPAMLFKPILYNKFTSIEVGVELHGFGGHVGNETGSITREWEWMNEDDALAIGAVGMRLPESGLHVVRESLPISALLFGIESSAPQKTNMFGGKHTVKAAKNTLSPFGSRKWRDYRRGGQQVPAELGGLRVSIDRDNFARAQSACQVMKLSRPSEVFSQGKSSAFKAESELFRKILQASDHEVSEVMESNGFDVERRIDTLSSTGFLDDEVRSQGLLNYVQ